MVSLTHIHVDSSVCGAVSGNFADIFTKRELRYDFRSVASARAFIACMYISNRICARAAREVGLRLTFPIPIRVMSAIASKRLP